MLSLLVPLAFAADPVAPQCSVLIPRYTIDGKNVEGGGAMFALKVGDKTALVTPHDVFGPNGGMPAQLGPDEIVARVTALTAYDVDGRTECGRSTKALKVEGAAPSLKGDSSKDVAVFQPVVVGGLDAARLTAKTFAPLPLAAAAPKVGDPAWLAYPVAGVAVQPAKVVEIQPGAMYVEYTNKDLDVRGTLGAPILDASGAVIGMNVGFGKMPDGTLVGSAVPQAALKDRVTAALAAP
jgi:hypothetical protein